MNVTNNNLAECARTGDLNGVKYCLDSVADVNAEYDGALRIASMYGHIEVIILLLDHGADVHADSNCHTKIVKLLLDHGCKFGVAFK